MMESTSFLINFIPFLISSLIYIITPPLARLALRFLKRLYECMGLLKPDNSTFEFLLVQVSYNTIKS